MLFSCYNGYVLKMVLTGIFYDCKDGRLVSMHLSLRVSLYSFKGCLNRPRQTPAFMAALSTDLVHCTKQ